MTRIARPFATAAGWPLAIRHDGGRTSLVNTTDRNMRGATVKCDCCQEGNSHE